MNDAGHMRLKLAISNVEVEVEGPEDFCREVWEVFRPIIPATDAEEPCQPAVSSHNRTTNDELGSVAEFLERVDEQTEMGQVVALAFYKKYAEGKDHITPDELVPMFNEALIKLPKHIDNALGNAGQKTRGWMRRSSDAKGSWEITPAGENKIRLKLAR